MTTGMRYQKVLWHHDLPDEPVVLYAEISSGREVRKVEIFREGATITPPRQAQPGPPC
jgi:hypothetical protein